MSTTIPIQDLDPSTSPPSDRSIRAVVTLSWPYSSSTRQCALLLSERDFRLRARGGQIRVEFSGPAARAVAESKPGIGDEVLLELGAGEWAAGGDAAIRVPGKSVGKLHFRRGVRLTVQKEGNEDVEIIVADDAVEEEGQERSQLESTPTKATSPATAFRSSIGGPPGSVAIYSSPAYMRKAAKFSYLEGISRLFDDDDDWENQDLPRKKARTSMGDVKSWRVVDRTPSPERPASKEAASVDVDMEDVSQTGLTTGEDTVLNVVDLPLVASASSQTPIPETHSAISSSTPIPTPTPTKQGPEPVSPAAVDDPRSSSPAVFALDAPQGQPLGDRETTTDTPALPNSESLLVSPTPRPSQLDDSLGETAVGPQTPGLLPLSSAALPSTAAQVSPLVIMDAVAAGIDDGRSLDDKATYHVSLPSEDLIEQQSVISTSSTKATESLLDQLKSTAGQSEPATDPNLPEQDHALAARSQWSTDDLAEQDEFSEDGANEVLSAQENDDELMLEDDAEDVFNANDEGEEPSEDDTNEDEEMHHQWLEESTTDKDFDAEDQASAEDHMDNKIETKSNTSVDGQVVFQKPGFAPASTLLHATGTLTRAVQPPVAIEETAQPTPLRMPFFGFDGAAPTTEVAEVATPVAKLKDTPKRTPQSAREKVMKRTFHSLFGIRASPSPEKEDMPRNDDTTGTESDILERADQHKVDPNVTQIVQTFEPAAVDSHLTQITAVKNVDDTMAKSNVVEKNGLDDRNGLGADSQDLRVMVPSGKETLNHVSPDIQDEVVQPEPTLPVYEQSPEVVDLASNSDVEESDSLEEPEGDHTTASSSILPPTPQKHSRTQTPGTGSSVVFNGELAETAATTTPEDVVEATTLMTTIQNVVEESNQHDESIVEQSSSVGDLQDLEVQKPMDVDADIFDGDDDSASPEVVMQSGLSELDMLAKPMASSTEPNVPAVEAEDLASVDMELNEKPPLELTLDPIESVSVGIEELSREPSESQQPSGSYEGREKEPASVHSGKLTPVQNDIMIVGSSPAVDVEMLDEEHRESTPLQASFQSQVVEDSIDAVNATLHERSSLPTSRDTVEDSSPMVLDSMAQRITDLVSKESSMQRLQELQSQDDIEIGPSHPEDNSVPLLATFIEEDLLEQTPTRSTELQTVDVESSPSELHTISPVGFTQAAQEQESTPQATFEVDAQESNMTEKEVVTIQHSPENHGYLSISDAQALESQLQETEVVDNVVSDSLRPLSPVPVDQKNVSDKSSGDDEQTCLTLPLIPSTTQTAGPEAQLSRANISQQPTSPTSQLLSSAQLQADLNLLADSGSLEMMSRAESREWRADIVAETIADGFLPQSREHSTEPTSMPPPESALPPKTPAKKSLRSRLSNVPDVISAWFSPKRSSTVAQQPEPEPEQRTEVETPTATVTHIAEKANTSRRRASGLSTPHTYFTSLTSLGQRVNPSSQQAGTFDVLAVVTDFTREPERAKAGPRDYYTTFQIVDPSIPISTNVRVEVFRPWKAVLPAAGVGDVVLLRAFVVKSKEREPYLLSTDTSSWCVWRFAEHSRFTTRSSREVEAPVWARRMSHCEVREEVKGPPVEYGMAEKEQARKLREWWVETRGEAAGGASEELVEGRGENAEVVEL
jgi:hypothetical protein